jgi:perosamine synthetase
MDRAALVEQLRERGVGTAVHWRPLHLHPYYEQTFGWLPEQFPAASREWLRNVSLPLFPSMREDERQYVASVVRELCSR